MVKLYVPIGPTVAPLPGQPTAIGWREATDAEIRSAFFRLDENMDPPVARPSDAEQAVVDTIPS